MKPVVNTDPHIDKLQINKPNVDGIKTYPQKHKLEINGPNVYALFKGSVSPYPIALDFAIVIL